jgi:hypothetical protein
MLSSSVSGERYAATGSCRCTENLYGHSWRTIVIRRALFHPILLAAEKLTNAVRENICGRVRRQLVPGTLEV